MAQRMLDEKIRVTEDPPEPENAVPFPTDARFVGASPVAEDLEVSESDGETLGSRDTEEDLSTISEEEEEDLEEMEKENIPPRPSSLPLDGTRNRKRRSASSPGKELKRPPIRKRAKSDKDAETAPASKKRRPRGNYRSWVRHRVAICQALRDAVFDRRLAAEILKRARGIFVPPTVLGYYARKLLELPDEDH
ncbi:protein 22K [Fowl aviadenovirus E]|uniref:Protein 22K n=2 Tax=Fowl aviadenovirus E TaxID=190065 RepID=A0A2U9N506_9ADEN|nr:protein 22K [Fowl adenovirus 8b]QGQ62743.1 protein 22K [Fowl aviadenovirus E]AYC35473.1 protein 22K [Fowl adenovirus 8b]QGQ62811.1 protein 22K [Fowl aviadenovirus E]QGQ62881.1 protein 22K [Fowl aviadenovirus E]